MGIMAAGVHDAWPLTIKFGTVGLKDRERVHIGPQANSGAAGTFDITDNACFRDARFCFDTQIVQYGLDEAGGFNFSELSLAWCG